MDWLRINYAMQDRNPVDNIRFYSRYNDFQSFKIPRTKVSFMVPEQYEELAIRIFTRDPDKVTCWQWWRACAQRHCAVLMRLFGTWGQGAQ